jgi:hypothetical protein
VRAALRVTADPTGNVDADSGFEKMATSFGREAMLHVRVFIRTRNWSATLRSELVDGSDPEYS